MDYKKMLENLELLSKEVSNKEVKSTIEGIKLEVESAIKREKNAAKFEDENGKITFDANGKLTLTDDFAKIVVRDIDDFYKNNKEYIDTFAQGMYSNTDVEFVRANGDFTRSYMRDVVANYKYEKIKGFMEEKAKKRKAWAEKNLKGVATEENK